MTFRLGIVLLALAGASAFAPAPFPRPQRGGGQPAEITLELLQGTWRVVKLEISSSTGRHEPFPWSVTHVCISGTRWESYIDGSFNDSQELSIDPTRKPTHLNFDDRANDRTGFGIVRRQGQQVQVMYTW